jgi:hypothetical protein
MGNSSLVVSKLAVDGVSTRWGEVVDSVGTNDGAGEKVSVVCNIFGDGVGLYVLPVAMWVLVSVVGVSGGIGIGTCMGTTSLVEGEI